MGADIAAIDPVIGRNDPFRAPIARQVWDMKYRLKAADGLYGQVDGGISFVSASLEGWAAYMKAGPDIAAANALIKKDNPDMDDEKIAYAIKVMNERGIVNSGDALTLGVGAMTEKRWKSFYETMAATGAFPTGLDVTKAYSLEFINKGIGKA
jgi:hypothetical protein